VKILPEFEQESQFLLDSTGLPGPATEQPTDRNLFGKEWQMKGPNVDRMKLMFVGCAAAVALGGGRAFADFVIGEATCIDMPLSAPGYSETHGCSFSADGLRLYFAQDRAEGYGGRDIWVAVRKTMCDGWAEPVNLGPNVNGLGQPDEPAHPAISPDELELYFNCSCSSPDLMRSTRESKDDPWGPAVRFTRFGPAFALDLSADGLTVYFDAIRPGGYGGSDIWMATRETVDTRWGEPVNLGPNVNDARDQYDPSISSDGLALFFNDGGAQHISVTIRDTKDDSWSVPILLGPVANGGDRQYGPEVSPDGSILYFDSKRPGGSGYEEHFCQASIIPVVDLNGDSAVDCIDVCDLVNHWGIDDPLYDIGPMPWGDGVVDGQDLLVLAEHIATDTTDRQ
jgi:hypothetical protein